MLTRDAFKVARVFAELLWLSKYVSPSVIDDAKIYRLTLETMVALPGSPYDNTFLLDHNGDKVAEVGIRHKGFQYFIRDFFSDCAVPLKKEETIIDTITRIGDGLNGRIAFAISFNLQEYYKKLVIYKMPKTFPTMASWIAELKRRADNAVKQQIAAIDADGEEVTV